MSSWVNVFIIFKLFLIQHSRGRVCLCADVTNILVTRADEEGEMREVREKKPVNIKL